MSDTNVQAVQEAAEQAQVEAQVEAQVTQVEAQAPAPVKKTRRPKRKHTTEFKVQIIEAIKAGTKASVLAAQHDLSMGLIYIWQGHYEKGKYTATPPATPEA
jgi:hypothetical protein